MSKVEFFYDLSSPWTRLAFHNVQPIVHQTGAELVWRPFLVGGVFNAVNNSVYAGRSDPDNPKLKHAWTWLKEWADLAGVSMKFPSPHHPLKSVLAMRVCCALEADQEALLKFSESAFDAYYADQMNLDDPVVLSEVADGCGFEGANLIERASEQVNKDRLRANTQEAIDRGAYGSPSIFVNEDRLYFGNDQLPLVRRTLENSS